MSEEQQDAERYIKRAGGQGKNAAKNVGRAMKVVADDVVEESHDAAEKLEGTVEDAVDAVRGRDARLILATAAVAIGGTYLAGRFNGFRRARRSLAEAILEAD